jgi:hypothetical protein
MRHSDALSSAAKQTWSGRRPRPRGTGPPLKALAYSLRWTQPRPRDWRTGRGDASGFPVVGTRSGLASQTSSPLAKLPAKVRVKPRNRWRASR